jgi:hypothetical protein
MLTQRSDFVGRFTASRNLWGGESTQQDGMKLEPRLAALRLIQAPSWSEAA